MKLSNNLCYAEVRMKKWQLIVTVILLVATVVAAVLFILSRRLQRQQLLSQPNVIVEDGGVAARFVGNGLDTSPDAAVLNRVIRGQVVSADIPLIEENRTGNLSISVQLNWPNPEPVRQVNFQVIPNTEFLCWGEVFTAENGTSTQITQTPFLIDDNRKLMVPGETSLDRQTAVEKLLPGREVVLALTRDYVLTSSNQAFQVAVIGCQ